MSNERSIYRYTKFSATEAVMYLMIGKDLVSIDGQRIKLTYKKSNLGKGEVPFFVCPDCSNPRRDMYLKNERWSCYRCHDLVYYSQQRTNNSYRYWVNRAEKEARKIDPNFKINDLNDMMNSRLIFPFPKAKYMRWSTHQSIFEKYDFYMFRAAMELAESLGPARRFLAKRRLQSQIAIQEYKASLEQQQEN